jgi:hypothetical protein
MIANVNTTLEEETWLVLNVTQPFIDWLVFSDRNLGLYLDVNFPGGHNPKPAQVGLQVSRSVSEEKESFLAAFFKSSESIEGNIMRSKKTKRAADSGTKAPRKTKKKNNYRGRKSFGMHSFNICLVFP